MKLSTVLPVAHLAFRHWHVDDDDVWVVVAKARFVPSPDGRFRADQAPPELRLEDEMAPGEPGYAETKHEADLAPGKPATDVLLRALARSPGGRPRPRWGVGITVGDRLRHDFDVRGPSEWRHGLTGWRLTEPERVTEVPLCHALAYGGAGPADDDPARVEAHEANPAGRGFASSGMLKARDPIPAPQIGYVHEFGAAGGPQAAMSVVGVTPVAKSWTPRRALAGTFDAAWQEERHPRMPRDYDGAFWNCAHPTMQVAPPLAGAEAVELRGVSEGGPLAFALPGVGLTLSLLRLPEGAAPADLEGLSPEAIEAMPEAARAAAAAEAPALARADCETVQLPMDLTTVEIDVQARDASMHALTLVWTAIVRDPHRHPEATIEGVRLAPRTEAPADAHVA